MSMIQLLATPEASEQPSLLVACLFTAGFIIALIAPGLKKQHNYSKRKEFSDQR